MREADGVIEFDIRFEIRTGKVEVNGPLNNKVLCYGILEAAKELVREYNPSLAGMKEEKRDVG